MDNLNSFFSKNALKIKVFHVQCASDFACTVVKYPRTTQTEAAVGNVYLVTVSPRSALFNFGTFIIHVPAFQISLYKMCNRTVFNKSSQHFYRQSQIG